jgi:phosphohistidine phosphatase
VKRLLLLRHAKACREKHGLDDIDRTLADRGRADAIRMGHFLKEEKRVPDLVLCSPAARTRQTLELILPVLGSTPAVHTVRELYLAKASKIVELVRQTHAAAGTLMVVGHNPGLEYCARALAHMPGGHESRRLYDAMTQKFPTAALAVIAFEIEGWEGIEPGAGELELFVRPKDLGGEDD